jgi:branched-chain amino acid transport system substrate-binding protein
MKKVILFSILISLIIFSGCIGDVTPNEEPLKIGVVVPLSGDLSLYGISSKVALEYAADNINWKINNRKIEFIYEDGKCDAKEATYAYNKLINIDQVDFIIGGLCSSETLAGDKIVNDHNVITISIGASSPDLRNSGEYTFSVYPLDDFETDFIADYIYNKLNLKKVAIIAENGDWGKLTAKMFSDKFQFLGGDIVITEFNKKGDVDLKTQLSKIKNSDAEIIFSAEYPDSIISLFVQKQELGIDLPVVNPQLISAEVIKEVGVVSEGSYTTVNTSDIKDVNFAQEIKLRSGLEIVDDTLAAPRAYDTLMFLKKVIEKENSFDPVVIKDSLYETNYSGIAGNYSFNEQGVLDYAEYQMLKVVEGKLLPQ